MPNAIFHAGARGVDRQPIFLTDHDRRFFIDVMKQALDAAGIGTVSFALMPNHFHWQIATADEPFDGAFHDAMTAHAVRFNRLYGRTGHLFEQRHWSELCEDLDHVENTVAYVHLNPNRAKLVKDPSDWEWSSYGAWTESEQSFVDFRRVSEITGVRVQDLKQRHAERIRSELDRSRRGMTVEALIQDTASMFGISAQRLKSGEKGRIITLAKLELLARAGVEDLGPVEVANALGCTPEALYLLRKRRDLTGVPVPSVSR